MLSNLSGPLWLVLACFGCSQSVEAEAESDWMLGTFSVPYKTGFVPSATHVVRYEFRDDGVLVVSEVAACSENLVTRTWEYTWRRDGDSRVIVEVPDPEDAKAEAWLITRGKRCTLEVTMFQDQRRSELSLQPGIWCMRDLPPCEEGHECATCEVSSCGGDRAPCDE